MTLSEAVEVKPLYSSSTLLAVRDESPRLIQEGIIRAKGKGESALYCIYVEEWPGLFAGNIPHVPNEQGIETLRAALQALRGREIEIIPVWTVSHNAAEAIAKAAKSWMSMRSLSGQRAVQLFTTCCGVTWSRGL